MHGARVRARERYAIPANLFLQSTSPAPSRLGRDPCTGQQIVGDRDAVPRCDVQCTFVRAPLRSQTSHTHYFWELSCTIVVYMCAPGVVS